MRRLCVSAVVVIMITSVTYVPTVAEQPDSGDLPSAPTEIVWGSYSKALLSTQYFECHGEVCPNCMVEAFPDPWDPFHPNGHGSYCEGIQDLYNIWYGWWS